ncbi:MAG: Sir2 silent information regulator family NAD-dependent deacetylase [Lachnospiraceae bacterium]|nr:Sir2 silent information regulator family NAD-dependent deacetylase [Lachnospiraceae bacterium]
MMTQHILCGKKSQITFQTFLSGTPARDYVFQQIHYSEQIKQAAKLIKEADYMLIGAGAGLSAAAGLTMGGARFTDNFKDFIEKYGGPYMRDMYSAGFYPFPTEEAKWGYWSKSSMVNRILPGVLPLYQQVYRLAQKKNYFVLTTNVDHQFYLAGFDDKKIFATQGDYGLIQCRRGCHPKTYDATKLFRQMDQAREDCLVPSYMVPKCPVCGEPMEMNLRSDQYFVEDESWHNAERRFGEYLRECEERKTVLLELGVGFNTPTIIRFPFEKLVREHKNMSLIRLNLEEAVIPEAFGVRAMGINEDMVRSIGDLLKEVMHDDTE